MKPIVKAVAVLCLAGMAAVANAQNTYTLPFVLAADNAGVTSFMRIINTTEESGTVQIHAIDDTGERFGPASLSIGADAVVHFTSRDLEQGNAAKGFPSGVGNGSGNWRLELTTALVLDPLAYIRTADGFVTSMHDVAPTLGLDLDHLVPFFNPGSNTRQVSRLRLINPGTQSAQITISGKDDAGDVAPGGTVRLSLPAGTSRLLSAQALESGIELDGSLGDGAGKWRLSVMSNVEIQVMSILSTPTGHVTNLSTSSLYARSTMPTEPETPAEPETPFQAPVMVRVPPGSFMMGSPDSEADRLDNEGPVHEVTIAYSFAVGKYEVTRGEFARFVAETDYAPDNRCWLEPTTGWSTEHNWRNPGFSQTDNHPVVCMTWFDAKAYVAWLSEKTGDEYRLLTETEWEYVARAGTTTPWYWGDSSERQCRYANARDASTRRSGAVGCNDGYAYTAPVGSYQENLFGVHDMSGNVFEWVEDCGNTYRCLPSYEPGTDRDGNATPPVDGSAWPEWGTWHRARRGGSWGDQSERIRSAYRGAYDDGGSIVPSFPGNQGGFRIARTL